MSRKLLKSTATVGSMTLLSRISGLVRDMVFAYIMGSGWIADAFFVAFRIPNLFRRIFAEGAFSQAFVPVLSERRETASPVQVRAFVDHTAGWLASVLLALTVVGIVFAPAVVSLIAPGFRDNPEQFALTVDALRFTFPYLLCISLVAMSAGVLNTWGRFAAPAITPVLLNLCLILAAFVFVPWFGNAALGLALGVLVAGIAQLAFQVPFLRRIEMLPTPRLARDQEPVNRVFKLMLPALFGASVTQINMLVNTILASFLVTGSVSWLYYSDRLMEFPLGVFGVALATVILPSLSKLHANGSRDAFSRLLDWSLRWACLIGVPASVGLIVLAGPIMTTIFQYGATTAHDIEMASNSLMAFAFGLVGFVLVKVLAPGFFARQDTRTPVRIAVIAVTVNIVLSLILFTILAHVGLALAISIAAWVNAGLLLRELRKLGVYSPAAGWGGLLVRIGAAVLAMGLVLIWGAGELATWLDASVWSRVARLGLWILVGAAAYFSVILISGIRIHQFVLRRDDFD
ncbi:MAG: murein biosynthesis integral membrane protein MurJ [Gammaproteobacteria bacterium]|nr:murein biosynthesis integral membrane protein MurJ [Gammaproteobacteria bacterium]